MHKINCILPVQCSCIWVFLLSRTLGFHLSMSNFTICVCNWLLPCLQGKVLQSCLNWLYSFVCCMDKYNRYRIQNSIYTFLCTILAIWTITLQWQEWLVLNNQVYKEKKYPIQPCFDVTNLFYELFYQIQTKMHIQRQKGSKNKITSEIFWSLGLFYCNCSDFSLRGRNIYGILYSF